MEYQRLSSGTPYSRKLMSNGTGGLSGKHVYDGVFGGAAVKPAGTSRVKDYREIFGGSGANTCSIPILEVPELDEGSTNGKAYGAGGDAQRIDYSKIFGGLGDADFGVAHEELFAKPKKLNDSFKQTRSPTQGRPQLTGSERFIISEEQKVPSSEASFQSFDGVKQFNVSYNKSNRGSKNGTNGTTHVAQFHAVPGYTFLVDEMPPSKMTEGSKTVRSVLNDAHLNVNVSEGLKEGKAHRKAVSGPQPSVAATNSFRSPAELQKKSSRTRSISGDVSFDAFEIGLGRNPPSSSPANFSNNNWGSNISMNSKFQVSRSDASGGVSGNYSPAFSDEEVDANSDAAASAAALRKAIEEAQMKIKVAKGLMERKKGLQNRAKMSFDNGVKSQKREFKTAERVNVPKEQEIQENCETKDTPKQDFTSLSEVQNATKATALTPDLEYEKQSPITNIAIEQTHCLESKSRSTLKQAFTSLSEKNATKATVLTPNLKDLKQSPITNDAVEETQCSESKSSPNRAFTRLSEENATKATILTPDLKDEKHSLFTNNVVDEKLCFESISAQMHNRLEEAEDWESTEEFFEALESEEHSEVALKLDQVDGAKQMVPSDHENERVEKMTAEEKIKRPEEFIEEPKSFGEPLFNGEEIEREVNPAVGLFQWNVYGKFIKSARELYQEESDERLGVACKQEEADETPEVSYEWEECETKLEKLDQPEENAGLPIQDWVETETIHRKALTQKEKKNRSDEFSLMEENDGGRSEMHEKEENVEGNGEGFNRIECERKLLEGWNRNLEEYDENHNFHGTDDAEMSCEVHKEEIIKVRFNDLQLQDKDEADERLGEDGGIEGHRKVEEPKQNEQIVEETDQLNGAEKSQEQIHEWIETEMIRSEIHHRVEDEKNMEATECTSRYGGKNLQPANDAIKQEENEHQDRNDKAWGHKINFGAVCLTAEVLAVKQNDRIMETTGVSPLPEETEKESKAAEEAHNLEEEETFETAGLSQGFIIVDANKKQTVDITEAPVIGKHGTYLSELDVNKQSEYQKTDYNSLSNQESFSEATRELVENGDDNMQSEHQETDYNSMSNQENCTEEVTSQLVEDGDDMYGSEVGTHDEEIESSSVFSHEESLPGDNAESFSDPEFGGNGVDIKQSEVASNFREHENSFESSHEERCADNSVDIETSQETCMLEGQEKTTEISEEEELSQGTDEKENQRKSLASEERKTEHTLQKDVEVEKEHPRKKEQEKEWEMEKEKERIAVERAIREARERAFAEARERAEKAAVERAAAEAKQRLMTETQEKLEKASTRVSDKLANEKASMEAKLKAERIAVERATAEARQRALEKALSEKAAFKARNEVDKSAAGNSSNISKDNEINSNDRCNVSGPSSGSRYAGSLKHEKFNGANVASAQRSKATLERHQRTAERAAKALAEKNMRDLLAQKEQAERNRLAETLDIDVKRWSSGKERNLRALLSTLQYILGPDSGWQPIPLMDLISSTAVKKAYRKATLFVHPDKLQQRGASIQQKYTCEKVFDLLKEAWNKFSAEER